jgi:cell division septal protein FtsQ
VGLVLSLAFLGAAVAGSFRVKHVVLVGAALPSDAVVQASDVLDQNIFSVQADAVVRRLGAVNQIAVRRVDISFPDTVTIYAQARQPAVGWRVGGSLFLLDRNGDLVGPAHATTLPTILGPDSGMRPPRPVVAAVVYAHQALVAAPHGTVAAYRYGPIHGLTIVGQSGWTAIVGRGSAQTLANRISTLIALLKSRQTQDHALISVDLRYRPAAARLAGV